jgi:hypothetical protein
MTHSQNVPKPVEFKVAGEPLNKLLIAVGNKLSRAWPAQYENVTGARELFVIHPEFCVSLPVLNRSILDILFTLLFLLEDVPNRCAWFRESDFRSLLSQIGRNRKRPSAEPRLAFFFAL